MSPSGVKGDLLFASSGIEAEIASYVEAKPLGRRKASIARATS